MASSASTARRARQAELARALGVTRQAINDLVKRGILPQDGDGTIDVELARRILPDALRGGSKTAAAIVAPPAPAPAPIAPAAAAPAPGQGTGDGLAPTSYHVARTLREAAEAKIAGLKYDELRGELVRRAEVRAAAATLASNLNTALDPVPARIADAHGIDDDHRRRLRAAITLELDAVRAVVTRDALAGGQASD